MRRAIDTDVVVVGAGGAGLAASISARAVGRAVVCVEVKARARSADALFSITPEKRYRTERAAVAFMATHKNFMQLSLRFDVMVVTSGLRIIHLTNAWSSS